MRFATLATGSAVFPASCRRQKFRHKLCGGNVFTRHQTGGVNIVTIFPLTLEVIDNKIYVIEEWDHSLKLEFVWNSHPESIVSSVVPPGYCSSTCRSTVMGIVSSVRNSSESTYQYISRSDERKLPFNEHYHLLPQK